MSLLRNGSEVSCDGPGVNACGCPARAALPVALSARLAPGRAAAAAAIYGWVFVADGGGPDAARHYCPACAQAHPHLLNRHPANDALPTILREA